jgi:hypothetical protein
MGKVGRGEGVRNTYIYIYVASPGYSFVRVVAFQGHE